jgi:hypothetical protein
MKNGVFFEIDFALSKQKHVVRGEFFPQFQILLLTLLH